MAVEQSLKDFKAIQTEYDRLFSVGPIRDEDRAYLGFAKKLLRQKPDVSSLLDLACGGGYFMRHVHEVTGGKVALTGIDISSKAIELAKKECPSATVLLSAGEKLPFSEGTFDAITCLGSLEHFLDIGMAIREMIRVGKPEAIYLILVPNVFWYKDILSVFWKGNRFTRNQTHERFASLGEWKSILEENGLAVMKTEKYNGIARTAYKQRLKDWLIPLRFSYHFLFVCRRRS